MIRPTCIAALALVLGAACEPGAETCANAVSANSSLELADISRCESFANNVFIDVQNKDLIEFPNLRTAQNLNFTTGDHPASISLPQLTFANTIHVQSSQALLSFSAPSLLESTGLSLVDTNELEELDVASLETLDGDLTVRNGALPGTLRFPALQRARSVTTEARLTVSMDFPELVELTGASGAGTKRLQIRGDQLLQVSAPKVAEAERIELGRLVEDADFSSLGGEVFIDSSADVPTSLSLKTGTAKVSLWTADNTRLTRLSMPDVVAFGELKLGSYPALTELDMPKLETIDDLESQASGEDPCLWALLLRAADAVNPDEYNWTDEHGCFE